MRVMVIVKATPESEAGQLPGPEQVESDSPLNLSPLPPADTFSNSFWSGFPKLW